MKSRQSGITLVVSLIMLIVLTLLVVSAVRFGNINLKIAGNAQTEAESTAATQVAVEQTLTQVLAATDTNLVPAQDALMVSTGGATYTVKVDKPTCLLAKNVKNIDLDPTKNDDLRCYGNVDGEAQMGADGKLLAPMTACKSQQWDIAATTTDSVSGAKVSILQGVSQRVGSEKPCP